MSDEERPGADWDPALIARMRVVAQVPKAEADAAEAARLKRPSPKRKRAAK